MGSKSPASASASPVSARSIRDRFPFKRNLIYDTIPTLRSKKTSSPSKSSRSHYHHTRRILFLGKKQWLIYLCVSLVIFTFVLSSMVLQSPITTVVRQAERMRWRWSRLKVGSSLRFVPPRELDLSGSCRRDLMKNQPRIGVRPPRIGLILGNIKKDPSTLMLYSVMKNLKGLGYLLEIYALGYDRSLSIWQEIGGQVSILSPERYGFIDWSMFEGIIVDSLEAKDAISSLMQEPFCSVPLMWIIQEDTLANRLQKYVERGWGHLICNWKYAFSRADVVVFPEFSLPMLYSMLDTGNFFVIPGSPVDVWAAESYSKGHSKSQLRKENGFDNDEVLILIIGRSFSYNELAWDYNVAMLDLEPLLLEYAGSNDVGFTSKFIFLWGNSSSDYNDALQDIEIRLKLNKGSLRHYGISNDVNDMVLMADIIVYGPSQDEQGFPPLLSRAMSFGIPVITPDYPNIRKYIVDGVHGLMFRKNDPDALRKAFSRLISDGKLSQFAHSIASSGRLLARNMFAAECMMSYAKLLEDIINFPSDVRLPGSASQLNHSVWMWRLFRREIEQISSNIENLHIKDSLERNSSIVYELENNMISLQADSEDLKVDVPTTEDWDILRETESPDEVEKLEMEEIEERTEKEREEWDDIYRNARKAEKFKFEKNERDEGELERAGQPLCIFEVYNGAGGWPFLHHGSLYRGLSLSTWARRPSSDDVDAVGRLPILNDTYYRNILCEIGGMLSIAKGFELIHRRPWIGFQSWRAAGRKVALSQKAEEVLEKTIQSARGDVIYFWACLDMDGGIGSNDLLTFWSTCDIMNGGRCRTAFEDAFRRMYGLPSNVEALPPMPDGGGHWSALSSWVMPTPSFVEFIMFLRMFVDSLHSLHINSSKVSDCLLGFSAPEKKHCYCGLLEILVNVWVYHSARKMVYLNPHSGFLQEQHPIEQRKGFMWTKYFNSTLLKSMEEDLAEAADENDPPYETWLWPLTGKVYWQGMYEREREERYRQKMGRKRKTMERLLVRLRHGYKQKKLGRRGG